MESTLRVLLPVLTLVPEESLPANLNFGEGQTTSQALSDVYFTDYDLFAVGEGVGLSLTIVFTHELSLELPGLQGAKLVLGGAAGEGVTSFRLNVYLNEQGFELRADELQVSLRFPPSILKPVPAAEGASAPPYAEIAVHGSVSIDHQLDVRVHGFDRLSLAPVMVGGSGVVLSAQDVILSLSRADTPPEIIAAGFEAGFLGVFIGEAKIKLPDGLPDLAPDSLVLRNAVIGSGGVSGRLEAIYGFSYDAAIKRFTGDGAGDLFDVPFGVGTLAIEFRQNDLIEGRLAGQMLLPFFDHPVGVTVALGADGSCSIDLGAETSLATLEHEDLLRLAVQRLSFEVSAGGLVVRTGGAVTLLIGHKAWPSFRADDISIDAGGNISLHGGGLTLKDGEPLDLGASPAGTGRVPGVTIEKLDLAGNPLDEGLTADAELSTVIKLGPFSAALQQVGVRARLAARPAGGGAVAGDLSFRPPARIAIDIASEKVSGGGLISRSPAADAQVEYSGVLRLQIAEKLTVQAIGLLITRLPGGTKGYSLLIFITAEDFKPVPLPLGFRLTGIGGLLALNRTFAEEVLRAGLKNHTLDSVMFPKDPVRNAPQILSNLNKVFPPAPGHHLFGPVARIEWGTPTLITAELAVVLELGARLRLLVLAQIAAILPKPENDLIRLQMDGIGLFDFDQGTAALDATLYDSRLLKKFVLTGDMAMRLKWEAPPNFALAIGGLHPAFNPPPNFPKLERMAINLTTGDNPRFRCEAYLALTANTVQFGARAELYAAAAGFSIHGETGFDVLIQLDPFQFLADFYAQVQLKRGSTSLCKVRVEGALAGPRPLHLKAKATFEVLWWDISIRVDKTLVEGEKPPPAEPVDVLPRLIEALGNPGNWTGRLPEGQRPVVTLRAGPGAAGDVLLHPLGTLMVKQSVVPLDIDISRFGQAAPAGARRFTISSVSLSGQNQPAQSIRDFFAPAQFLEMSDDEKLSRPSFEPMAAGVSIGSDGFAFSANAEDWLEIAAIEFETIIVDKQKNESHPSGPEDLYQLSPELLGKQARFGAAGASDIRRSGKARYRTTAGKHRIKKEGWSIVSTDDLTVQPAPGIELDKVMSYSEAVQALQKMTLADPAKAGGLKILRLSELAEA